MFFVDDAASYLFLITILKFSYAPPYGFILRYTIFFGMVLKYRIVPFIKPYCEPNIFGIFRIRSANFL